jgi:hypothetical protein
MNVIAEMRKTKKNSRKDKKGKKLQYFTIGLIFGGKK